MKKTELKAATYGTLLQKKRTKALKEEAAASLPQENSGEETKALQLLPEKAKSVTYAKPVNHDKNDSDIEGDEIEQDADRDEDEDTDEDIDELRDREEYVRDREEYDEDDDDDRNNDKGKGDDADRDEDGDKYYAHDFTEENEYMDEMHGDSYLDHIHSNRM